MRLNEVQMVVAFIKTFLLRSSGMLQDTLSTSSERIQHAYEDSNRFSYLDDLLSAWANSNGDSLWNTKFGAIRCKHNCMVARRTFYRIR